MPPIASSEPTPSATMMATTTPPLPTSIYHRGDPLDIPFIDNHLLIHLLFPRITNSIKWTFPQVYLDWTTGVTNENVAERVWDANANDNRTTLITATRNPLFWKKIVEILLQVSLVLGSCHRIHKHVESMGGQQSMDTDDIWVMTPAMKSLGMFLRPSATTNTYPERNEQYAKDGKSWIQTALHNKINSYGKVFALVLATSIIPSLYEELKYRRQRQLEDQERQQRLSEFRREFSNYPGSAQNSDTQQNQTQQQNQQTIINQRALKRKSAIISFLADTLIGMRDIIVPPLQLINYISYLWGMSSTPNLSMRLLGWEYASVTDPSSTDGIALSGTNSTLTENGGQQYQRHVNFQYGNRRHMVEEALRTVSAAIPPRSTNIVLDNNEVGGNTNAGGRVGNLEDAPVEGGQRPGLSNRATRSNIRGGNGWVRKRALSFMGVVEEADSEDENDRYTLPCSKCRTESPMVPYIASCGHCYCYLCLRMAVTDDLYFRCVDCGKPIDSSCRPKLPVVPR